MERDILSLYERSQVGPLAENEVKWLQSQVQEYPYFPLPRLILARQSFLSGSQSVVGRDTVQGATYVLDRNQFRDYLIQEIVEELDQDAEASEAAEANAESSSEDASVGENEKAALHVVDAKAAKAKAETIDSAAEEANGTKTETIDSKAEEVNKAKAETINSAAEEEVKAKAERIDSAAGETSEEKATSVPGKEAVNAKKAAPAKNETASESPSGDAHAVGKINWYLNTTLEIKVRSHLGKFGKIKAGLFDLEALEAAQPETKVATGVGEESGVAEPVAESKGVEAPKAEEQAAEESSAVEAEVVDEKVEAGDSKVESSAVESKVGEEKVETGASKVESQVSSESAAIDPVEIEAGGAAQPPEAAGNAENEVVAFESKATEEKVAAVSPQVEEKSAPEEGAEPEALAPTKGSVSEANTQEAEKVAEAKVEAVESAEPAEAVQAVEAIGLAENPTAETENTSESKAAEEAQNPVAIDPAEGSAQTSPSKEKPQAAPAEKAAPATREEKAQAVEALLARNGKDRSKEQQKAADAEAKAYEIGSFSSFSFMDEVGDGGEGEVESLAIAPESITLQGPEPSETGFSELIIENNERRLEILVTPEELEKYFKGKLPANEANAGEHDPVHLQFNFSVSEADLMDEMGATPGENPVEQPEAPRTQDKKVPVNPVISAKVPEPINPVVPVKEEHSEREEELVNRFIEQEPTISRGRHTEVSPGDLSKQSSQDDDNWVTETLAKVYAMQGNHSRAIRIYKKLALIFPEKSGYFENLIQQLKQ